MNTNVNTCQDIYYEIDDSSFFVKVSEKYNKDGTRVTKRDPAEPEGKLLIPKR